MENTLKLFDFLPHQLKNEKQLATQLAGLAATSTMLYVAYKTLITQQKKHIHGAKEIPEPSASYPYVGHMFSLGNIPAKTISQWHKELGPIIKIRMGVVTWIVVDDPQLAHDIFVTHGIDTSHRPESYYTHQLASKGGKGLVFVQPGAKYNKNRAATTSILAPKLITEDYGDSIKRESRHLASCLVQFSELSKDGIDPSKHLELSSMNVIFSACFGKRFETIDDPEFQHLVQIMERHVKFAGMENELSYFLPAASLFDYFFSKQEVNDFITDDRDPVFHRLMKEAMVSEGPNLVKSLEENGHQFEDEDDKMVFMFDLIIAGTDTVAITLHWTFALLCHYPDMQTRISDEIDQFIEKHGRSPEFEDRDEFPFSISVMKESMRFKPITPFGLPHAANRDVLVNGYLIPKGATIITNMTTLHTSNMYTDPHTFNPDRFLDNPKTMLALANGKLEERDQFNFGFGRRICPGIHMAEVELFYAFTEIFSTCTIQPVNGVLPDITSMKNGGLTLNPLPYKVKFVKRP